ncbi:hypothetical protein LTR82_013260 [Friedmanniomyces endolithicus]|uniref:F-box domain-containing protein n=1 Tax=Friedmanniomyces endolithicus TaxID=329885 RepID=A0AAN6J482_9PEZI|nr:hypothetical protein LTR82_013260 [Friedmanniomyces endolithicus]
MQRNISQLDEGYSEGETRSHSDSEITSYPDMDAATQHVLSLVLALPEEQRRLFAESIIRSLPNPDKDLLGRYCNSLTHFDPAHYLPAELMLSMLSYLEPRDLLAASSVSRAWRERGQDEKLWRTCFAREGWVLDRSKIEEFEERMQRRVKTSGQVGQKSAKELQRRSSRKRKTEEAFNDGEVVGNAASLEDGDEAVREHINHGSEDAMEGVELDSHQPDALSRRASSEDTGRPKMNTRRSSTESATSMTTFSPRQKHADEYRTQAEIQFNLVPGLWRPNTTQPKVSWPYLYKQRARLERNWEKGAYTMFRLPRPEHPEEGHTECVYTIQHTSSHLVSGSRDWTSRIWDLNTYRLKGQPLRGHDASVLCLQFDERPEHDLIVSGGSDAHVLIWRFSTGEVIRKMMNAHDESVLNLRFDDRYIVTCSKDKSVKVWSRRAMHRSDPLVPSFLLPLLDRGNCLHYDMKTDMFREHALLINFGPPMSGAHQAAVNAVQIHDNIIVSASGDRTVKAWNIDTGKHTRTYSGHTKGIACVQYDGRRIISGSSDNTVRIFDAQSAAEVACLTGHESLVRTVQARFGDMDTLTDEELYDEAKATDKAFFQALEAGMPMPSGSRRLSKRNAGSSRPEDLMALGTKVPPGGGGSRWAKIVSGSYDETIILWKRDREGKWAPKQTLSMDGILRNNARRQARTLNPPPPGGWPAVPALQPAPQPAGGLGAGIAGIAAQQLLGPPANMPPGLQQALAQLQHQHALAQIQHHQQQAQNPGHGRAHPSVPAVAAAANGHPLHPTGTIANNTSHAAAAVTHPPTTSSGAAALPALAVPFTSNPSLNLLPNHPPPAFHPPSAPHTHQLPLPAAILAPTTAALLPGNPNHSAPNAHPPATATATAQSALASAAAPAPAVNPPTAHPLNPNPNPNPVAPNPTPNNPHSARESNRVFKLQFDARRIVCCSQHRVIVGWDFANGEAELERVGGWCVETS